MRIWPCARQLKTPTFWSTDSGNPTIYLGQHMSARMQALSRDEGQARKMSSYEFTWIFDRLILLQRVCLHLRGVFCCNKGKSHSNGWFGGTPISGNHHLFLECLPFGSQRWIHMTTVAEQLRQFSANCWNLRRDFTICRFHPRHSDACDAYEATNGQQIILYHTVICLSCQPKSYHWTNNIPVSLPAQLTSLQKSQPGYPSSYGSLSRREHGHNLRVFAHFPRISHLCSWWLNAGFWGPKCSQPFEATPCMGMV